MNSTNSKLDFYSRYITYFFSIKWIFMGVVLYSYGFFRKKNLYFYSFDSNVPINQWDIVFGFLSNIYVNIYIILPYVIFTSISIILTQYHYEKIIRLKSYKKWIYETWLILAKDFSVLCCVLFSICLILLIKVPFSEGWSMFSKSQFYFSETQVLQGFINFPFLALFLTFSMIIICISCLHLFFALIFIFTKKPWITVSTGVTAWLSYIVAFNLLAPNLYVFSLTNYLVLHAALSNFNYVFTPFLFLVVLLLSILFIISRIDLKKSRFKRSVV